MMYLQAGKYFYNVQGKGSEIIKSDTKIIQLLENFDGFVVTIEGSWQGSFFVDDKTKILTEKRKRKFVFRKKPCHSNIFDWKDQEWMAGVPIYCKVNNCPLIKHITNGKYSCDYNKSKLKDYKEFSLKNNICIEYVEKIY